MDGIVARFTPQRSRDAYATIRGFVYQVQLTIERWLGLQDDQHLELECGEDIDLVAQALAEPEQEARLLEQVKLRSKHLTLRSRESIESLASAVEHITNNAGMNLVFRFTTNASISIESPPLITGQNGLAGISVWEQIRENRLDPNSSARALSAIQKMLLTAAKPDLLNPSTWTNFQEYLLSSGIEGLEHLIACFEWSTGNLAANLSRDSIISTLLRTEHAPTRAVAENIYQRLFLYVFTILSNSGRKILSREQLIGQLSLPSLSESESQLLKNLICELIGMEARIDSLETSVKNTERTVGELNSVISRIVDQSDDIQRVVVMSTTSIEPPPLSQHAINRQETVQKLQSILVKYTWLAIYGTIGMGKTHMANLLSRSYGRSSIWIRLRGLSQESSLHRLSSALEQVGKPRGRESFETWYKTIFLENRSAFLLIIDDLPRLGFGDSLIEHIVWLSRACAESDNKLLTTSPYTIPARVRDLLPDSTLSMLSCPPLLDEEARTFLLSYGAPDEPITAGIASAINTVFKGHPALFTAQARHLKSLNWRLDSRVVSDICNGSFPPDTHQQIFVQLMESIEDTQSRELLYRLSLIRRNFGFKEVSLLSSVPKEIDRSQERIYELMGLWIQEEQNEGFVLSPLLSDLGTDNLVATTKIESYFRLGRNIVTKTVLRPDEILDGVFYLREANRALEASRFLLLILWQIHTSEEIALDKFPVLELVNLWSGVGLPERLEAKSKLLLRGLQAVIGLKSGITTIDEPRLLREVRLLIQMHSPTEPLAVVGIASLLVPYLLERNLIESMRFLGDALKALPRAKVTDEIALEFPPEVSIDQLVWIAGVYVSNSEELIAWTELLRLLSPDQIRKSVTTERAERAFYLIPNEVWMKEADKKPDQRRWSSVLNSAELLVSVAADLSIELLWALSIRAQMIIAGEYMKDLAEVERIAAHALERPIDRRSKFIIQETLGRQYLYANETSRARVILLHALQDQDFGHPIDRIETLLCASRTISEDELDKSIELVQKAEQICQAIPNIPVTRCVEVQGELALANWHGGKISACFDALDQAYQHLYKTPPDNIKKKRLAVLLNHAVSCILGQVKLGGSSLIETPLPAGALARGLFLTHGDAIHEKFNDQFELNLIALLGKLAALTNKKDRAAELGLLGIVRARELGQEGALTIHINNALPVLIERGEFGDAISLSVEAASIMERESRSQTIRLEAFFLTAMLPIVSKVACCWVNDRQLAKNILREVTTILKEIDWADQGWKDFLRLVEGFLNESLSISEILALGRSAARANTPFAQHIAFILATLHEYMPAREAIRAHLAIASYLIDLSSVSPFLWESISDFFVTYWLKTFEGCKACFSAPRVIEQQFKDIHLTPLNRRSKYVLQVISAGLGIAIDPRLRQWLET